MTILIQNQDLSEQALKLVLSNEYGYPQNATSVKWSIYSASGSLCSGFELDAINQEVGVYLASWNTKTPSGGYRILWSIKEEMGKSPREVSQSFYVADLGTPFFEQNSDEQLTGLIFRMGSFLTPSDLFVVLKDEQGVPQDAHAVTWYVKSSRGCQITQRAFAIRDSVGVYHAPWVVTVNTGDYSVVWEFQQDPESPLQSVSQDFSVIGNLSPFITLYGPSGESPTTIIGYDTHCSYDARESPFRMNTNPIYSSCSFMIPDQPLSIDFQPCRYYGSIDSTPCSISPTIPITSCTSVSGSTSYEVSRQVHLAFQTLPLLGAFTNQDKFPVPTGIRKVTFYITYSRGDAGGQPVFHLLWGNGVEEITETILDSDITQQSPVSVSQDLYLQDLLGPAPIDSNPVSFVLYASVPGGASTVRLTAAEKGNTTTPGSISITLTAST
jgi:hypothetical protein